MRKLQPAAESPAPGTAPTSDEGAPSGLDPVRGLPGYDAQTAALSPLSGAEPIDAAYPELHYNAQVEGRDPEARNHHRHRLPFTDDGWDATHILNYLTQVDFLDDTELDGKRCTVQSSLAGYVVNGPDVVSEVASNTLQAIAEALQDGGSDAALARLRTIQRHLRRVPARIQRRRATWDDLQYLAAGIFFAFNPDPTEGLRAGETVEMQRMAGPDDQQIDVRNRSGSGPEAFTAELDAAADLRRGQFWIVGVQIIEDGGHINHAVNVGKDQQGQVYLFDPMPRNGRQMLFWPADQRAILRYVADDRPFQMRSLTTVPQ